MLLLEDEALVSMLTEAMLEDLGCEVVGPAMRVSQALEIIAGSERLDGALLDVNVHGEAAYPAAEALIARGTPFAFVTGYGEQGLPDAWRERPVLQKPFSREALAELLLTLARTGAAA